jgi:hypothetical protein
LNASSFVSIVDDDSFLQLKTPKIKNNKAINFLVFIIPFFNLFIGFEASGAKVKKTPQTSLIK